MEFPVIVIDSINNSIKSGEDEEDIFLQQSQRDEYPYLERNSLRIQTQSNNDDGDSGIHESSEVLGPSPVPSYKMLIESSVKHNDNKGLQNQKRSLSANSLIERKRSFSESFMKSAKNRNYSIDTGRPATLQIRKSFSPYKLMILDEDGQTILVQKVSRDSVRSFTHQTPENTNEKTIKERKRSEGMDMNDLCQIHLLLIIMKIVLGGSVSVFGISLKIYFSSLEVKDCGYWASSVLLVSGLISIYFATDRLSFENRRFHNMYLVLTVTISCSSSILCFIASLQSGAHGNWISFYADDCSSKKPTFYSDKNTICCVNPKIDEKIWSLTNLDSLYNYNKTDMCSCVKLGKIQRFYLDLSCKYLFSSLKDYFVLICSLMAVGSGCEIWFAIYLLRYFKKSRIRYRESFLVPNYSTQANLDSSPNPFPSPIIPVVLFPKSDRICLH